MKKVSITVHDNLSNELFGVEELSGALCVSRSQLNRRMKALTGATPIQFLGFIRLYYGMELLMCKRLSVAEVADQVGFNSNTYFIKCFSDHFGTPPGKFKHQNDQVNIEEPVPEFVKAFRYIISEYEGNTEQKKTPTNLPDPPTRFFGRQTEMEEVIHLLNNNKLVSVLGAGGSGKSRFSIELGKMLKYMFPDGIWLISLAPITQEKLVLNEFVEALHMVEQDPNEILKTLTSKISHKKALFIVDNCEHLIDECARILAHLTHFTLKPKFLVTSREALRISGECLYILPTLPVPSDSELEDNKSLTENISVQLFMDRARLVRPDISWNQENRLPVMRICQKLDGIPLALELAASRTRFLTPTQIADHLTRELKILSTDLRASLPRHKTLEATIDWSIGLLSENEKLLFFRLCLFNTIFDVNAVREICSFSPLENANFEQIISSLVDKSILLMVENDDVARYKLLEPTKQYAYNKLKRTELDLLKERYTGYYMAFARRSHRGHMTNGEDHIQKVINENANFLGALELVRGQPQKFAILAGHLWWYWWEHSEVIVCKDYLRDALMLYQEEDIHLARVLLYYGSMEAWYAGNNPHPEQGLEKAVRAIEIVKKINNEKHLATMYPILGFIHLVYGKFERGVQILNEGLNFEITKNDVVLQFNYKLFQSWYFLMIDEPEKARPLINEIYEKINLFKSAWQITTCMHIYADIPLFCGDFLTAERRFIDATITAQKLRNDLQAAIDLTGLAMALAGQKRHAKAIRLTGAAHEKFEEMNAKPVRLDFWEKGFENTVGKSIQALDSSEAHLFMAEGRSMGFEEAVEYASRTEED